MSFQPQNNKKCASSGLGFPYYYHLEHASPYRDTIEKSVYDKLEKLIAHLSQYDQMRWKLENCGAGLDEYKKIVEILNTPVQVASYYGNKQAILTKPESLRNAIKAADFDLRVDVRRLSTGMPVYYICRVHRDYWGEYSLIVEDIYMGHGYPLNDERFVQLMSRGHETYHIRLSQFREDVAKMIKKNGSGIETAVDEVLYYIGRHVFQSAWHEDQRLGIMAANSFGLKNLRDAVELLYLCLSGELCELRSAVSETMLMFFEKVYPQPAIHAFLKLLNRIDGEGLNTFPRRAMHLYSSLARSFSRFLAIEVPWGYREIMVPIWKLLYGNFSRIDLLGESLKNDEQFIQGCRNLEARVQVIIDELLTEPGKKTKK